jgi:SPP1 gp7 family putative phage head morphogenesis protein
MIQTLREKLYTALAPKQTQRKRLARSVVQQQVHLLRQDIGKWRTAQVLAKDLGNPQREPLYNLYEDLLMDAHLVSVIQTRKINVMGKPFKLVNAGTGEEDKTKTTLFMSPWFRKFLSLSLDAEFWGHSLIEFGDMVDGQFLDVELVPRANVVPEFGYVLQDVNGGGEKYDYRNDSGLWVIEVGSPRNLGLLEKAAPHVLWKKAASAAWSEYCEIFGMPIRLGKTDSQDTKERADFERMLRDMGSAAYIMLSPDENVEFAESTRSDAYMVYNERIERANSEISKLILGQTMTADNGSSRSQSEVHERVAESYAENDMQEIADVINFRLLPFLIERGYQLQGYMFEWDFSENLGLQDQWKIVNEMLQHFNVPAGYITQTFGVPVEEKATPVLPDGGQGGGKPLTVTAMAPGLKPPEWLSMTACCEHTDITASSQAFNLVETVFEALISRAWDSKGELLFDTEYYFVLNDLLKERLYTGFGKKMGSAMTDIERHILTLMEANLFHFSAGKNLAVVQELNQAVRAAKSFTEFEKAAAEINSNYNRNWLRTEYNFTKAAAQNGAAWIAQKADAEVLPYVQWRTVNDANVRDSHRALHGKVWDIRKGAPVPYPPAGWNCRCEMVPLASAEGLEVIDNSQAKELLAEEWENIEKWGFDVNRGETGEIFTANQMYAKTLAKPNTFGLKGNGLKPFAELNSTDYPTVSMPSNTVGQAESILLDGLEKNMLKDYAGRLLSLNHDTVRKHLQGKYLTDEHRRQDWASFVKETLISPDEVFFIRDGKNIPDSYHYRYVKYYQVDGELKAMSIYTEFKDNLELSIRSWYPLAKPDELRTGSLVHKKAR